MGAPADTRTVCAGIGKTLKAKTVKGAHMMELSLQELETVLPGFLREWLNEFLNTHDIV